MVEDQNPLSRFSIEPDTIVRRGRQLASELTHRIGQDQVIRMAAALSYTSTLALVPMLTVIVSVLAGFPAFSGLQNTVQEFFVNNLVPDAGEAARDQIASFIGATGRLSVFGMAGVLVTAILLLLTIETAFNRIFRVQRSRPIVARLIMYWTVLTLGPLLLGLSLSLRGYFGVLQPMVEGVGLGQASVLLAEVTPFILTVVAFLLVYVMVPSRSVALKDAAIGALTATILLGVLRQSFGVFIGSGETYRTIYGAVAAVPVFLVWMYMSWLVILFGAVVAASLPAWRRSASPLATDNPISTLRLSLDILGFVAREEKPGRGVSHTEVLEHVLGAEEPAVRALEQLTDAGYIAFTDEGTWVITRSLKEFTLYDLMVDMQLPLVRPGPELTKDMGATIQHLLDGHASFKKALGTSIADVIQDEFGDKRREEPTLEAAQ